MSAFIPSSLVARLWDSLYNVPHGPRTRIAWCHCADHHSNPFCERNSSCYVIMPLIYFYSQIFWNIFLICLGRHPIQNPGMIKPEIKGLPKSVVERIPLVIYIPPPPQGEKEKENDTHAPHVYPPKNPPVFKAPQKRFKLLRNFSSFRSKKGNGNGAIGEKEGEVASKDDADAEDQGPIAWEDNWEKTDYPFVALEGNRAACAICLLDFEEPKKKHPLNTETETTPEEIPEPADTTLSSSSSSPTGTQDATISEEQRQQKLRLEDAGEGPQPLRLLACGHVFHVSALIYPVRTLNFIADFPYISENLS